MSAPLFDAVAAVGYSLSHIQQAGRPQARGSAYHGGLQVLVRCHRCLLKQCVHAQLVHAAFVCAPPFLVPRCLCMEAASSCIQLHAAQQRVQVCRGCRSRTVLADSVPVASRASVEVWAMSTPTACLLLSRVPPASARLFAEFRRLRGSLPPADAQRFALHEAKNLRHAEMMAAVRLCSCAMSSSHMGACRAAGAEHVMPLNLHLCFEDVPDMWPACELSCMNALPEPEAGALASSCYVRRVPVHLGADADGRWES